MVTEVEFVHGFVDNRVISCRKIYNRKSLFESEKNSSVSTVLLDGDAVRELFGGDLGYDEQSRIEHIKRIQRLTKFLTDQGIDVVVAALYSK